jgi:hypothetical protein
MAGQDPYAAAYAGQPTAADLLCVRCAAPLESEAADAVCGRCGLKVTETTRRVLLKANPVYLENLRTSLGRHNGVQILLMFHVLLLGPPNLMLMLLGLKVPVTGVAFVMWVIVLLVGLTMQYTYWRLTEEDHECPEDGQLDTSRLVLRRSIGVACLHGLASTIAALIVMPDVLARLGLMPMDGNDPVPTPDASMMLMVWLPAVAWSAISAVQVAALSSYLASVARRLSDPQLVRRSQMYVWLMPLLHTVGIVAFGVGPVVATALMVFHVHRLRERIPVPRMTGASMVGPATAGA